MASLSPEMGGTCTLGADGMYYPNLELPEIERNYQAKLGKHAKKLLQFGQTGFIMTLFKNHIFSF